jgi:hypothetical protein
VSDSDIVPWAFRHIEIRKPLRQAKKIDERFSAIPLCGTRSVQTMSKPTARVVLITLIGIVLIAAAYVTVQSAFAKAESAGVQSHNVSGLQTNFNHDRSTVTELQALQAQNEAFSEPGAGRNQGGGGCDREAQSAPLD